MLGAEFFVAVNGSSQGAGTKSNPWDLQTALLHPSSVNAGDVIWIQGGVYRGVFNSTLSGNVNSPIIVRAAVGEIAIIDGNVNDDEDYVLNVAGEHTWYWGLEITNSDATGSNYYKGGINLVGANVKIINCKIHNNGGNGIGFWRQAINSEVYGCLIYHNGFQGTSRGHGHGIYSQNETGTKILKDNIIFNAYGNGIQIYTEGGNIKGYEIEGNMLFNNGIPGAKIIDRNILIGGAQQADRITIKDNYVMNRPDYHGKASVQLGYESANQNTTITGNMIVYGSLLVLREWNSVKIENNTFAAIASNVSLVRFEDWKSINELRVNYNSYYFGTLNGKNFNAWKSETGQDGASSFSSSLPTKTEYFIRKNQFEAGRANLFVTNWAKSSSLNVDLSSVLKSGAVFEIWDVVNLAAGPIITDVYKGGNYNLPLKATGGIELPIRADSNRDDLKHTLPDFATYLIVAINDGFSVGNNQAIESETHSMSIRNCYPNPVVDVIAVDFFCSTQSNVKAQVFDNGGRLVLNQFYSANIGENSMSISLSNLPSGVYVVLLTDENNTQDSYRIIKK